MKRLSLFDQLQIRFPIRARTNVRRSAEAGAVAESVSKSGFGGSLLTNMAMCPRMQADYIHSFDRTDFVAKAVHIERYIRRGWVSIHIQPLYSKNVAFLLRSCCSSPFSDDFLSHSRFLAFRW